MSRYPALLAALAQTILAFFIASGHLTAGTAGVIEAAVAAGAGLAVGLLTDKFTVALLTGFINAMITVLVAFNVPHVTASSVSLVDALLLALAAFFVHSQATPKYAKAAGASGEYSRRL